MSSRLLQRVLLLLVSVLGSQTACADRHSKNRPDNVPLLQHSDHQATNKQTASAAPSVSQSPSQRAQLASLGQSLSLQDAKDSLINQDRLWAKIILIGVDGVSLNLLKPYMEQGDMPTFKTLSEHGHLAPLKSFWPLRTMQVWTSLVTGKLPGQHGIWDHLANSYYNPPEYRRKKRYVYSALDRRSKALWLILGQQTIRTLTVGWPTSYPAENIKNGVMVAPKVLYDSPRKATIKGAFWKHVKGMVQPLKLEQQVLEWIVEPEDIDSQKLRALAIEPAPTSPLLNLPKVREYVYSLRWSLARAINVETLTRRLANVTKPDVIMTYFQCSDSLLHRFWIFHKTLAEIKTRLRQFGINSKYATAYKHHFGQVVQNCYRDLDQRIGRMLHQLAGPETLILIVSDHGFGDGPKRHPFRAEPYGGIHWSDGIILAAGAGVGPGSSLRGASVLDITPSILAHLGLPVGEDMQGRPLFGSSIRSQASIQSIQTIPSYEKVPQSSVLYREGYPPKPDSFIW